MLTRHKVTRLILERRMRPMWLLSITAFLLVFLLVRQESTSVQRVFKKSTTVQGLLTVMQMTSSKSQDAPHVVGSTVTPAENKQFWKSILLWNTVYEKYIFREGSNAFQQCEFYQCFVSHNRTLPLDSFDAVIFNGNGLTHHDVLEVLKEQRGPKTKFIFQYREPPTVSRLYKAAVFKDFFNWTMTYRNDSDIFDGWGRFVLKVNESQGLWIS